jgi:hypothetical protein
MDFSQNNIGFGQTSVFHNSRIKHLVFCKLIPYTISGCVCLWIFFGSGHGKGLHNGARSSKMVYVTSSVRCAWSKLVKCYICAGLIAQPLEFKTKIFIFKRKKDY